ncbi:hypothetical protein GCM10008931_43240 [Oceanobacillus oncorhynchi subsp. oncorhynchi]|uniref:hypothetical protein n=1 Tax=Oceanobacillus oncorhynchi TaxID=545501 RepID=UPI0031E06046
MISLFAPVKEGQCYDCNTSINPDSIYCTDCYNELIAIRREKVEYFQSIGLSFSEACQKVAAIEEQEAQDIKELFQ